MKVLIVGNGAREHAIAWRLAQSPRVTGVFVAPGNAGVAKVATCVPIDSSSIIELADFALGAHIDLTVVGPELPLTLGIVDEFQKRGLAIFGPTQAAAEIEGSKVYAKRFLREHGIPSAAFDVASSAEEAERLIAARTRYPVVLKADGLAAGKGVFIAANAAEARSAVEKLMVEKVHGNAGAQIVLEDFLEGTEISFQVLTDGQGAVPLASASDYKRLLDGDQGPNTGGMGALSPSRILTPELGRLVMTKVVQPTLAGLVKEGRTFAGVLYCGLMVTADGPLVLEYNARFGDPETQSVFPRLETDPLDLFLAAIEGKVETLRLDWKKEVSVSVVLASGGYPGSARTGFPITGIEEAEKTGAHVFHAGTVLKDKTLVTSAGRVLTVNACAPSRARAADLVYKAVEKIKFAEMHYRTDVGRTDREETNALNPPADL